MFDIRECLCSVGNLLPEHQLYLCHYGHIELVPSNGHRADTIKRPHFTRPSHFWGTHLHIESLLSTQKYLGMNMEM